MQIQKCQGNVVVVTLTAKKINIDAIGAMLAHRLTHAGDETAADPRAPPLIKMAEGLDWTAVRARVTAGMSILVL